MTDGVSYSGMWRLFLLFIHVRASGREIARSWR